MAENLEDLIALSRRYGADPEFVLAGGGNTSFKTDTHLYIKRSGASLGEITAEDFVRLDRRALQKVWQRTYPEDPNRREAEVLADLLAARTAGQEARRPSVETPMHDFFPQAYVVHTHPALVNGLLCSRDGAGAARRIFGDGALWIPTVNPGYVLAATIRGAMEEHRRRTGAFPEILLLQNHGLCVAGNTPAEIEEKTRSVVEAIRAKVGAGPDLSPVEVDREQAARLAPALRMLLGEGQPGSILTFAANRLIAAAVSSSRSMEGILTTFSPDHIVYCNDHVLRLPAVAGQEAWYGRLGEAVADYRRRKGLAPKIVAVEKLGVFAWGTTRRNALLAASVFQDALKVAAGTRAFGGPLPMPPDQVRFIREWEVEAFRKKVSAGVLGPGRMAGRVALVTGAAQGFGLGIAEALVEEGAHVALADLNAAGVRERAAQLEGRYGAGKALALEVDVTDPASVRRMVTETVLACGGLDLFVSNAGVLRAGGLADMDAESFDLVTRVNYTGYFLGVQAVVGPMKLQHRFRPEHSMDIIQINSKSGLAGSNRNFAYAGSKFGGIGLTQSFALELVKHRIKVNSVCPGNFFDGPLWSDPEKGLFVQYLKAGKVPGARTTADVRAHYESRVPMGRGCSVRDVARAIFYLVEQEYETGQALPVTGGQNMLR